METILNLVWSSVSLGLLLVCGAHVVRGGADRRRAVAAVALLCLVCLLFPVISATDDVNATPALVETNKFKQFASAAPDTPAVLALAPVQMVLDHSRWIIAKRPDRYAPSLADAFSFKLHRRPPPA